MPSFLPQERSKKESHRWLHVSQLFAVLSRAARACVGGADADGPDLTEGASVWFEGSASERVCLCL